MAGKIAHFERYDEFFQWVPLSEYILYRSDLVDRSDPLFLGVVDVTWDLCRKYSEETGQPLSKTPGDGTFGIFRRASQAYNALSYHDREEAIRDLLTAERAYTRR